MAIIIKCKMCGGDLALAEGSSIATCEYCGTEQTIPNLDDEKKLVQFERADRLRRNCEFDKAAGVYESIVEDYRQEAEAYWGLVLCKYGIEYVDDPTTGKKIPTCHRSSFESVMEDTNFEQTLENADAVARKVYREEAKQIEEIRKGILEVSSKEEPYDIFICYKETDEKGERTMDSVLAQDLYDALTDKGYRVFFARITLEDKLGQEYEPYIFAALNSAKVMLAVGTDYEYYNAVWVKNEWSRYLKLMEKDKDKYLIPCYKGIDAYDMPKEFARLQAQDLGKMGAVQDILRNMEKFISLKGAAEVKNSAGMNDEMAELIDSGYKAFENKKWEEADAIFEKILQSGIDSPDQIIIKQNIRQSREETQLQLRRKKCRKHNLILTGIVLIAELILFKQGWDIFSTMLTEVASPSEYELANRVLIGIHAGVHVPLILASIFGMSFVGKRRGQKSFLGGLTWVLSVLGIALGILTIWLFRTQIAPGEEATDIVCEWLNKFILMHGIVFVLMFFRKKV